MSETKFTRELSLGVGSCIEINGIVGGPESKRNVVEGVLSGTRPITLFAAIWVQFENREWREMQEANARLFVASPELYEACAACLEDYEADANGGRRLRRETIIEMLRAALSKASVTP